MTVELAAMQKTLPACVQAARSCTLRNKLCVVLLLVAWVGLQFRGHCSGNGGGLLLATVLHTPHHHHRHHQPSWCSAQWRSGEATVFALNRCSAAGAPLNPEAHQGKPSSGARHHFGAQRKMRAQTQSAPQGEHQHLLRQQPLQSSCPPGTPGSDRPAVLAAVVALNNQSFGLQWGEGSKSLGPPRGLDGFLDMLAEQDYPKCRLSLALLVSSEEFYPAAVDAVSQFVRRHGLSRAVVAHRVIDTGIKTQAGRHNGGLQRRRRSALARLRNLALSLSLDQEDAVLWVDSDIVSMPKHTLGALLDSGKDIVTTITKLWSGQVYDLNAWRGPRRPFDKKQGESFIPAPVPGVTKLPQELESSPEAFVPLDSVGGCTTLVRADVHREGALFTPYHVVGTSWERDGYDGVETEGLCYVARFLGRSCWLATRIVTYHASVW